MADLLYLDDLTAGAVLSSSRAIAVRENDIIRFAQEFDPQPFHLDAQAAAQSFFGGLAASGWHTASLTMRLLTETVPLAGGLIGAGGELKWLLPVRPGDTLRIETEVHGVTPNRRDPPRGFADVSVRTLNQHGEVVQEMRCSVMGLYRR